MARPRQCADLAYVVFVIKARNPLPRHALSQLPQNMIQLMLPGPLAGQLPAPLGRHTGCRAIIDAWQAREYGTQTLAHTEVGTSVEV